MYIDVYLWIGLFVINKLVIICCLLGFLLRWKWVYVGSVFIDLFVDVVGLGKFVIIKFILVEKLWEYCEINYVDVNKLFRDEFVVSLFIVIIIWFL